ncbi:MAG: hypothetical protein H0V44_01775 [Planctomycetes bacterium]|nr:hypothetical protein [Planctomycetota bacterium]
MLTLALLCAMLPCSIAPAADPALASIRPAGTFEIHGKLAGQPFWARVLAADAKFNHHRVMQLVYTPPAADILAGARLFDCPFVLVDSHACIVAWNGRDSLSQVVPGAPNGYAVTRELHTGEGDGASTTSDKRTIRGERGFDLHLAPLSIALTWGPDTTGDVAVVDLFGGRWKEGLRASWKGAEVTIAGDGYTVAADDQGQLARLVDARGMACIEIDGWTVTK